MNGFFKKLIFTPLMLCLLFLSVVSCRSSTEYRNPRKERGTRNWGPMEISVTVDKMVVSLYQYLKRTGEPAYIELQKLRNRSSEHINTLLISNEISTDLIKKGISFVDRSQRKDIIKEMAKGKSGLIDSDTAIPIGRLKSPNYKLYGNITDNVRYVDGRKHQYILVTLRLIQMESGVTVWQEVSKFLKVSRNAKVKW